MKSYPNQRKITIRKAKSDKEHPYGIINKNAQQLAMVNLNGTAYKFWSYLALNQDKYSFYLSQKECEKWGFSKNSYHRSFSNLVDEGYLIQIAATDEYVFNELPERK